MNLHSIKQLHIRNVGLKLVFVSILLISLTAKAKIATTDTDDNSFKLLHNLTEISVKDTKGNNWDGGCYTQNPTIKISYECGDPDISSVRVSVLRCNGIIRADYTYFYLEDALEKNISDIDIINIEAGETTEFDISIPGRYTLAYCAIDKEENTVLKGNVKFDSLYDDGKWITCGNAEVSSGLLDSHQTNWHHFMSNGTGFMEKPGDLIWWECPVSYPYYSGEEWTAPIEYHPTLKMYRIVNPFTQNMELKDYIPDDDDLLCAYYSNVAHTPEAFMFDRENPAWFLLNAESEHYTYCEPMRTGIVAQHVYSPYDFIAHPYNEKIGYVRYDVCPVQDIKSSGVYVDMPLDDESEASIKISFPAWTTGINDIFDNENGQTEYFTIDGLKVPKPEKGIYIVRQGWKSSKKIY
ncbi:MAG: hypothetical protein K2H47_00835 [Muribaculaceae bacterium]|nr:hypothetical protein [Muribaculaceae bacterium]